MPDLTPATDYYHRTLTVENLRRLELFELEQQQCPAPAKPATEAKEPRYVPA